MECNSATTFSERVLTVMSPSVPRSKLSDSSHASSKEANEISDSGKLNDAEMSLLHATGVDADVS